MLNLSRSNREACGCCYCCCRYDAPPQQRCEIRAAATY